MLEMSDEYYRVCIEGWADSVAERYGRDDMQRIQAEAWRDTILPQLRGMIDNWMELTDQEAEALVKETQTEVDAQAAPGVGRFWSTPTSPSRSGSSTPKSVW